MTRTFLGWPLPWTSTIIGQFLETSQPVKLRREKPEGEGETASKTACVPLNAVTSKKSKWYFFFPSMKKITGLIFCYSNNCPWDWLAIILVSLTFQSEMTWTAQHPWAQVTASLTASNYFPSTLDLLHLIVASKYFSKEKMASALSIYLNVLVKVLEHFPWVESRDCLCCQKHIFN